MAALGWLGAAGAWGFIAVFVVDGVTRPHYSPVRQPVSALALGPRGWMQTGNFLVAGALITAGAPAVWSAESILLAAAIGVVGIALVASGIFPMDPMRGYPPGAPSGDPETFTQRHRHHDTAGAVVFMGLPVVAIIAAFVLDGAAWRGYSGVTGVAMGALSIWFGYAWEEDTPTSGLIQRAALVVGLTWLGALFVYAGTQLP